jgi:hypothetical protein
MLRSLKTLFKNKVKVNSSLTQGNMYCVLKGTYSGEYFIFMESKENEHYFFSLPDKIVRKVPFDSFLVGINGGVLDMVELLPKKVFSVVEKEYFLINNNINGNSNSKEDN